MSQANKIQLIETAFIRLHILSNGHCGWKLPDLCNTLKLTINEVKPVINHMVQIKKLRISKSMQSDLYFLIVGNSNPEIFKTEIERNSNESRQKNTESCENQTAIC